jgi:hypothetical protein
MDKNLCWFMVSVCINSNGAVTIITSFIHPCVCSFLFFFVFVLFHFCLFILWCSPSLGDTVCTVLLLRNDSLVMVLLLFFYYLRTLWLVRNKHVKFRCHPENGERYSCEPLISPGKRWTVLMWTIENTLNSNPNVSSYWAECVRILYVMM